MAWSESRIACGLWLAFRDHAVCERSHGPLPRYACSCWSTSDHRSVRKHTNATTKRGAACRWLDLRRGSISTSSSGSTRSAKGMCAYRSTLTKPRIAPRRGCALDWRKTSRHAAARRMKSRCRAEGTAHMVRGSARRVPPVRAEACCRQRVMSSTLRHSQEPQLLA